MSVGWFITRVLTTSAGVPIVAATSPAQIEEIMCTKWQSGSPDFFITNRLTVSYVVKSPRLTKAARWTFGTLPFHRPAIPPRLTISRNAWAAPWTRGSKPNKRRLPSIWMCTLTKSAGEASHWAKPPAPTPARADCHSAKSLLPLRSFFRSLSYVTMRTPLGKETRENY